MFTKINDFRFNKKEQFVKLTTFCLVFFPLYFLQQNIYSQGIEGFKPLGIPEIYILPTMGSENEPIMSVIPGSVWQVLSATDNSIIYLTSDGYHPLNTVRFLTPLLVGNEKNGYLQVYTCPKSDNSELFELKSAVELGWIKKNNVILWSHCLIDSITACELQVLTYSSTGPLKIIEQDNSQDGIDLFYDPELKKKTGRKTSATQIYFVFKISSKAVLISTDRRLYPNENPNDIILGWIPLNDCFFISSRFWLSPLHNTDTASNVAKNKVYPTLFIDVENARKYAENSPVQDRYILWKDTISGMYPPQWFRFPIIDEENHIFKVVDIQDDFYKGYTSDQVTGTILPVFKKVTLISNNDLGVVLSNMNKLIEAFESSDPRQNMQSILVKLLSSDFQDVEEDFLSNLTFKEIIGKLFWICHEDSPLLSYKLRRIDDPSIVSDKVLKEFITKLKMKESQLRKISNKDYDKYSFISNNNRYFWIDIDYFL